MEKEGVYSVKEFKEQLGLSHTADWVSEAHPFGGWVFSKSERTEIQDNNKLALEVIADSIGSGDTYLAQFWVPEEQQGHLDLVTSDQPFAVGLPLYKGLCWYRQCCMGHRYRVDDDEMGAVGRAYRNRQIESTPDLRLYSAAQFPLRDFAAFCGFRSYYALPHIDLPNNICYGVFEVLCFHGASVLDVSTLMVSVLMRARYHNTVQSFCVPSFRDAHSEILEMATLARAVMPQLRMSRIWRTSSEFSDDLTCCRRNFNFIDTTNGELRAYRKASELHKVKFGEHTNTPARVVMLSKHKACIFPNICDFSIIDYPLAHYAQKARLSFCFAITLQSSHNSRDIYLVEFFLQRNTSEDAFVGSFLPLLLRIMEIKLKSFEFAYKGQLGEEIVVQIFKSKPHRHATILYQHQNIEKVKFKDECTLSDFLKYLAKTDIYYSEQCEGVGFGCVFWSKEIEETSENEVSTNSSITSDAIQTKIKCLMSEITSNRYWRFHLIAQFWTLEMDGHRRCLKTSTQPFTVGRLSKGLAMFRKQSMEHYYFVDERAKEDELGPPGRVFLNRIPETTSDLRLYSHTEFPLKNHVADYGSRYYIALPLFDMDLHTFVGVLELIGDKDDLTGLKKVLQESMDSLQLSWSHHNFKPSPTSGFNNAEGRELALTEIDKAFNMFHEIPQVAVAKVWVSYSECPSNNNYLRCMEQVLIFPTSCSPTYDVFQHVETRKGIVGMLIASESKTCFCPNVCEFSITEQPSAREDMLNLCFAIGLQSYHTGDLLYVLEFYLIQGPGKYEVLRSFLRHLLPMLKQTLTSFKVATGQELGEKLVVEVIEFSELNEVASCEMEHPDELQFTFKSVRYGNQKHLTEKLAQFAHDVMEFGTSVAEVEHCSTPAANLQKNKAANRRREGNKGTGFNISFKDLQSHFGHKRKDAAKALNVSESTFKRACKRHGIDRWPHDKKYIENPSLFMREKADEINGNSQQNMGQFNLVAPDMPSHTNPEISQDDQSSNVKEGPDEMAEDSNQHNMPLTRTIPPSNLERSKDVMDESKADTVVIKPKYKDHTLRIVFCRSEGLEKLWYEVGRRLKLDAGGFELKYVDEDNDEILLACDDDLQLCLRNLTALGKPYIQLLVQSKIVDCQIPTSSSVGIQCIPPLFHEYISKTKDVKADGHCGFRAIADLLGFGEDGWRVVRSNLLRELRQHPQLYTNAFIEHAAIKEIETNLDFFEDRAPEKYFLSLPEMGQLVASAYNVCLITLSKVQSMTFLPLRTPVPEKLTIISIALIDDHFIEVFLRPGHPAPPVMATWYKCHHKCAAEWDFVVRLPILQYNQLSGNNNLVEIVNLDD